MRISGLNILLGAVSGGLLSTKLLEQPLSAADEVKTNTITPVLERPLPIPSRAQTFGITNSTNASAEPRFLRGVTNAFDREVAIAMMSRLDPDVQRKLGLDPAQGVDTNQIFAMRRALEQLSNSAARSSAGRNTAAITQPSPGEPSSLMSLLNQIERRRQEADEKTRLYEQECPRLMRFVRATNSIASWAGLAAGLTLYVYISFCCRQLCWRTGTPARILIWLPRFKRLPLFQATGVSRLWFWLGFFIPLVGPCGWAICCWRLCDTFQKSKWLTLGMVCPFLGWIPLVYLAEATRAEEDEVAIKRLKAGYAF